MTDVNSLLELTKGKLGSKKKAELVEICKENELDEAGTKNDLTERIWEFLDTKRGEDEEEQYISDGGENAAEAMEEEADIVEEADVVEEEEEDDIIEETENNDEANKMDEDQETTEKAKLIDFPEAGSNKACFLEEQPPSTTEDDNTQTEADETPKADSQSGERSAPDPNRLYFGNLSFDKVDGDVREIFKDCGEITDIHIIRDRYSRRSQGYGFITFSTEEAKDKALAMDGKDYFGRPLKVNLEARNRDTGGRGKKTRIFIKNIPKDKTEDEVKALFATYGTIENFFFIKDHNTEVSRGFGFMDFATPEEAQNAVEMNNKEAFGGTIIVKIAEEKNSRNRGRGRGRGDFGGRGRGGGWRGGHQAYDPYAGGGYGYGGFQPAYGYGGFPQQYGGWGGYGGYGAWGGYPRA